jgi:hypothetical protein
VRRLNAYAAVVAGVFSAAVVAAAGITVWALRHRVVAGVFSAAVVAAAGITVWALRHRNHHERNRY